MGCVSSKHVRKEIRRETNLFNNGGLNHVVSLTSSTYGALKLETSDDKQQQPQKQGEEPVKELFVESKRTTVKRQRSPARDEPEVINTWELMEGLEEGVPASCNQPPKKSPRARVSHKGFADLDERSPLKFLNQFGSPRKARTFGGKENKVKRASDFSPKPVWKANSPSGAPCKAMLKLSYTPMKGPPIVARKEKFDIASTNASASSERKSFSPLFDPELVALYEREFSQEEVQIKRIISPTPRSQRLKSSEDLESMLNSFEQKWPPGGEDSVVVYTTTLRGIRKTFEDCNSVRSIICSYHVHVMERDVSMDSGFKEELRKLMGTKEVKIPLVFVKGRLIGGADQVVKLEEEGKLEILLDGMPKESASGCGACGGVRFVMCMQCSGSCKVLDEEEQKMVRCSECNENGLIQCPLCC